MKIIRVSDWNIVEQAPESGRQPTFSVVISDPAVANKQLVVPVPYEGVTDFTINPETHDLYISTDVLRTNVPEVSREHVFFRKKTVTPEGGPIRSSSHSNTPVSTTLGAPVSKSRKVIMDDETGAAVTVSKDVVAVGSPGTELVVAENKVVNTSGNDTVVNLPEKNHIMLKETGLMRILPRAFLPPFCFPDYFPDLQTIAQVIGTVGAFKQIADLLRKGP